MNINSIHPILKTCTNLKELVFDYCRGIGEKIVSSKLLVLTSMQKLRFLDCNIVDDDMKALASKYPNLIYLSLQYNNNITDECVNIIANHCPLLGTVNFSGCSLITGKSITHLSKCCTNLCNLDISKCSSQISDETLFALAINNKNMTYLDVSFSLVTNIGIHFLAQHLLLLQVVKINSCKNVTGEFIFKMRHKCKDLSIRIERGKIPKNFMNSLLI